jgi:AcrR family transcriptional regulator
MRKHFTDLDALMGEMMRRHLQTISQAMGAVPRDAPDRRRLQRAAYIEATRFLGAPTEAHLIYTTYRAILAEDERTTIEEIRDVIGNTLCPENPAGTLDLLDSPNFDPAEIEAMIAAANAARSAFAPPLPADAIAAHAETPAPIPAIEPPEDIDMAWSRIGGVEIPGGPLCQPRKRQPWDTPERLLSDAELHLAIAEARAPPTSLAA